MNTSTIPLHIAIVPDGNRRWAKARHLPTLFGHKKGVDVFEDVCYAALDRGVKTMTFWAFSTENWERSKREVQYLLKLFEEVFTTRLEKIHRENIRLVVSGRTWEFPKRLQAAIQNAVEKTKQNTRGIVHLCLNYGGRAEIVDTVKKIVKNHTAPDKITEDTISKNLYAPGLPEPDLIIRTSGEQRLSGYLLWEAEYAEFLFVKKHWPDFNRQDLQEAIEEYQRRQRRFGS